MLHFANLTPTRFRLALALMLGLAFVVLQFAGAQGSRPTASLDWQTDGRLHVFFHPDCPHCHEAIRFLSGQTAIRFDLHDISTAANEALLLAVAQQHRIPDSALGVPLFVFGTRVLMGFESPETNGRELLAMVGAGPAADAPAGQTRRIALPLLGEIDPAGYSLLALTALMGLSDGFNPCAMWVLVYLVSLVAAIKQRSKVWWLVGTFVLTSGILYFLFMTAWLNTFLVLGYIRPLTQAIALLAIGFGADHLFGLAVSRGVIACQVGNADQRQRTMQWVRDVVAAPIGLGSLALVIGLAFTVNAIEFVCSAALPAVYTHMLALSEMPTAQYYGYILLYVAFFMVDDLVIFASAAFALQAVADTRYAALSRAVGGTLLVGLGLWLLVS
jgi:hypothetical protein